MVTRTHIFAYFYTRQGLLQTRVLSLEQAMGTVSMQQNTGDLLQGSSFSTVHRDLTGKESVSAHT